jgi:Transposase and inactivated derivatives
MLATSDGQLLGKRMLTRLAELDAILAPYIAELQTKGLSLKSDPYYRQLQARIKGYVTNKIGRLLNMIAAREGEEAVASGGTVGFQRWRTVQADEQTPRPYWAWGAKGEARSYDHQTWYRGPEVPSPYTSQECSACWYTHKLNRKGTRFHCRFCGLKLHADVNAARVIRSRRSRPTPDHTGPYSRSITLQILDGRHRKRWNLPIDGAVPGITGAKGQLARKAG